MGKNEVCGGDIRIAVGEISELLIAVSVYFVLEDHVT
jgi:hypothetical protein